MECILRNPDMSVKEIYSKAYDKMNRNPEFFLAVIKGYFIQVNELLVDINFFKKSIKLKDIKNLDGLFFYNKYYEYLRKVKKENKKIPRIPFTGEGGFNLPQIYKGDGFNLPEIYK